MPPVTIDANGKYAIRAFPTACCRSSFPFATACISCSRCENFSSMRISNAHTRYPVLIGTALLIRQVSPVIYLEALAIFNTFMCINCELCSPYDDCIYAVESVSRRGATLVRSGQTSYAILCGMRHQIVLYFILLCRGKFGWFLRTRPGKTGLRVFHSRLLCLR